MCIDEKKKRRELFLFGMKAAASLRYQFASQQTLSQAQSVSLSRACRYFCCLLQIIVFVISLYSYCLFLLLAFVRYPKVTFLSLFLLLSWALLLLLALFCSGIDHFGFYYRSARYYFYCVAPAYCQLLLGLKQSFIFILGCSCCLTYTKQIACQL
ncbi:hypothetical protein [Microbulbifer sp. HZ11]|uniref:hypothetical protein n=1 Tax=unclassified Microbulbifer TaxID=2619833 RepID=UPI0012DC3D5A|nr:hypothetical protein [Microbulbifer sp. HZ11]